MDLMHEFTVPADIDATWNAFNDLQRIAPCFPGATLTEVDGDDFSGSVKVKLGPISLVYNGIGTFVERDEQQHRAVIEAKGKDKRGNGTAAATVTATLAADGDGTTVTVRTDMAITGKPAQFGRGVIQDVSDKLLNQFVACISEKLSPDGSRDTDTTTATTTGPPPVEPGETSPGPTPTPPPVESVESVESVDPPEPTPSADPNAPTPPGALAGEGTSGPGSGTEDTSEAVGVNMLTTIGPVLLKRYGPALAGVLAFGGILFAIIRRARRR